MAVVKKAVKKELTKKGMKKVKGGISSEPVYRKRK